MARASTWVWLFDVDNTLIDNDTVQDQLQQELVKQFGAAAAARYWQLYEEQREAMGFADYLGALQRYRLEDENDPRLLGMSEFLLDYPFQARLYPGALDVIEHASRHGVPVILSDGDAVFQPRKVRRSGLWDAVDSRVLIYVHKEQMLDKVEHWYPAQHYVVVDDKRRILASVKEQWRDRVTTVSVNQGHYAEDPAAWAVSPAPDLQLERIGELATYDASTLEKAAVSRR